MQIKRFSLGPLKSNCYIVYDDTNAFIVDPGYPSQAVLDFIIKKQLQVDFIYITHGHPDHVGGIAFINERLHVPVYAPIKDQWWIDVYGPTAGIHAKITSWIREPMVFSFKGYGFQVYDTPGHSKGGTVLYNPSHHILFSGDTLFFETVGRTDIPHADQLELVQSIQKIYELFPDQTIVYPGHGRETTIEHEKTYNQFVRKKR